MPRSGMTQAARLRASAARARELLCIALKKRQSLPSSSPQQTPTLQADVLAGSAFRLQVRLAKLGGLLNMAKHGRATSMILPPSSKVYRRLSYTHCRQLLSPSPLPHLAVRETPLSEVDLGFGSDWGL